MSAVQEYWTHVQNYLQGKISKSHYQAWFAGLDFQEIVESGRKIKLSVPSQFNKSYLQTKYQSQLQDAINKFYPSVVHVEFTVAQPAKKATENLQSELFGSKSTGYKSASVNSEEMHISNAPKLTKNLHNLNPKYTFENFVVTDNNKLATHVASAISSKPGELYNPVFIYSGVGLGKTHLLQAIGQKVLENKPNLQIRYTTCETFFNLFINSIQQKKGNSFKDYYRNLDVLLIDDIQFIAGKEATQEAFFHTFNELHQNNKQIVITSDKAPKSLGAVEERLISRFDWGMVVDISAPSLEDRLTVLNDKVQRLGLELSQEHRRIIADKVNTNYRDLEGVLNRIQALLKLFPGKGLESFELYKILSGFSLGSSVNIQIGGAVTGPDALIDTVCSVFNLSKADLLGKSRSSHLAIARQVAMYLAKEDLDLSYPTVGKIFNRDHTTVMHAHRKIEMLKEDLKLKHKLGLIRSNIQTR